MKNKIKVMSILCTRPSAIKMAPVVHALENHDAFESIVCVTGQHRHMLDQVLNLFQITPHQDLNAITTRVLSGMQMVLEKIKPDCVLVQGDTTSTFACALASFYRKIPVGHVEAGLRTNKNF